MTLPPEKRAGRRRTPVPRLSRLAWLGLALVIGQLLLLIAAQAAPLARRTWRVRLESAVVRSARLAYGQAFADYVVFLRQVVPEEALVVIPPREIDPVLGEMPFMQYFLFPRQLTNCADLEVWAECAVHYGGPQTYLLAVDSFPPSGGLEGLKEVIMFDEARGVLAPGEGDGG